MTFPSCGNKCTKSFIFTSSFMANHTTESKKKQHSAVRSLSITKHIKASRISIYT